MFHNVISDNWIAGLHIGCTFILNKRQLTNGETFSADEKHEMWSNVPEQATYGENSCSHNQEWATSNNIPQNLDNKAVSAESKRRM